MNLLKPFSYLPIAVSLALVVLLMWLLRTCSSPVRLAPGGFQPGSGDTLNVAIDYSPLSLYRYDDTLGGFNYDLVRQVMSASGTPLKFHPIVALPKAIEGLNNGTYDLVVADVPMTANHGGDFRFSRPVYVDRQVLVTLDTAIRSQLDLAGAHVAVNAGSPAADRLRNLAREIGDTIYIDLDSVHGPEQLFILAATGHVRAAAVNQELARRLASGYPGLKISTALSFNRFQAWLLPADSANARSAAIDTALSRFMLTPQYRVLLRRYGLRAPSDD